MSPAEIAKVMQVDARTVRYLIEQNKVPGLPKGGWGRGIPRELTLKQSRDLAIAAELHAQGFRDPVFSTLLQKFSKYVAGTMVTEFSRTLGPITVTLNVAQVHCKIR